MSFLDNARPGSFKGVPFLMAEHTAREGQTRANYLFINTGRRVSKPLGLFPPEFRLNVFTHSNDADEYERRRDALRRALQEETAGTLIHPFLGPANVVAGVSVGRQPADPGGAPGQPGQGEGVGGGGEP